MSTKEAERLRLLKNHAEGIISLSQISKLLHLSYRQILRIWINFKKDGPKGLVSRKRNNQNRSLDQSLEKTILALIKERYHDYGPTLLSEKMKANHQITISREALRKIMIKHGLRKPKRQKHIKVHQRRKRRSCIGELIQLDGSPHAWFEDRGPYCTLLPAVDDATGRMMAARFEQGETTTGYFRLMKDYIQNNGKPLCLYTDKYGSFRVNQGKDRGKLTQFARAMKELNIEMITAHSPQAKGRIERANGILQDRLVKELREKGISTIEEGNKFLPSYLEEYNERFGKVPASSYNAHRELEHKENLDHILCRKELRKVSKNLEVSYKGQIYQIHSPRCVNRLRGAGVQIVESIEGGVLIDYMGEYLDYQKYEEIDAQAKILDHKELTTHWNGVIRKPSRDHPWR